MIAVDEYIFDSLMADLVGHERSAAAFVLYLYLWRRTCGVQRTSVAISLNSLAYRTGLAKSTVQNAVSLLKRRQLISVSKTHPTAEPVYRISKQRLHGAPASADRD